MQSLFLSSLHLRHGAQMVPFAGWNMPLRYAGMGINDSVRHTRTKCSLFDVSHMLQTEFKRAESIKLLRKLVPSDIDDLESGSGRLTLFLNGSGGIIDDAIVTKIDEGTFRVVSNAGRAERLRLHILERGNTVSLSGVKPVLDHSLLALQGPDSGSVLAKLIPSLKIQDINFMQSSLVNIDESTLMICRSGYTGEDGFEISLPNVTAEIFVNRILDSGVPLAGLAARDILRLEAGLLLNGQDMDETTIPGEVGLNWLVSKSRTDFIGYPVPNWSRRLIGLVAEGSGPIPRQGIELCSAGGDRLGVVTSGCYSPTLEKNICLAKLQNIDGMQNIDSQDLCALIRGVQYTYKEVKLPFVPHRFKKN